MSLKKLVSELGDLSDPNQYQDPLEISSSNKDELLVMLKKMHLIRRTEEVIADWIEEGLVKCPCHLGIGQEAVAVGVASVLRKSDRLFGTHRSHPQFLAMTDDAYSLLAEVLGKATGCAKGVGGSQHLIDEKNGFYGSVPIVGGTVPLAVGAGLAAKMDKKGDVACCFFGDGAAEEGVVQESLNLASVHQIPVLFVCENNLYSSHLDISMRQPCDRVSRYADAHKVPVKLIDGNDVLAVRKATEELLEAMRKGEDCGFLEAVTYRWRGHVGPKEDIDVGVRRKSEDLVAWKKRDPIKRLAQAMISAGHLTEESYESLKSDVFAEIDAAKAKALSDPYPEESELFAHVYA